MAKASAILIKKGGGEEEKKEIWYKYQFVLIGVVLPLMACLLLQGIWMQENLWVRDWNEKDEMWECIAQEASVWIEASKQETNVY